MFAIACPTCATSYLVSIDDHVTLFQGNCGIAALMTCPSGHLVVHEFTSGTTRPALEWDDFAAPVDDEAFPGTL